jgi:arylsulfatase A-like enzyme
LPLMVGLYVLFLVVLAWLTKKADLRGQSMVESVLFVGVFGAIVAYILHLLNFSIYMTIRDLPVRLGIFEDEFFRAFLFNMPCLMVGELLRKLTRKSFFKTALLVIACIGFSAFIFLDTYKVDAPKSYPAVAAASPDKPNVVILLADDLGYGDLGINGNTMIPTPNIDTLMRQGANFRQAYCASPICSPSRMGLMTGQHQQRAGFEHLTDAIAHHLMSRKADFANAGHELNNEPWWNYEIKKRGIDPSTTTLAEFLKEEGYATGVVGKWHLGILPRFHPSQHGFDYHLGTYNAGTYYGSRQDSALVEAYHPDNFVDLLEWQVMNYRLFENGKVWPNGNEEYTTDLFTNKASDFIEKNKANRFFLYLPFTAVHSPLQAPKRFYNQLSHIKDHSARVYTAMVMSLDEAVGKILQKLKDSGLDQNTIVVFSSDNGAPLYYPAGQNTPYYGGKMSNFEGGLHVPFCIKWPNHISPQVYTNPVSLMDVFKTVAGALNKNVPANVAIDGVNLLPFLTNKTTTRPHETMFWRAGFTKVVRQGDWKLHLNKKEGFTLLHDLSKDPRETTNLAASNPAKVAALTTLLTDWESKMEPTRWRPSADVKIEDGKGKRFFFPW